MSAQFILAPRDNFQDRTAPAWLEDYLVSEDELRRTFKVPAEVCLNLYFVCDINTPMSRLGLRT